MAIYFSIGYCQPFADMATERVDGFDSIDIVRADGVIVGIRLDEPREVVRLPELAERLELDPDRLWSRLRADDDVLIGRRAATWGGGGA